MAMRERLKFAFFFLTVIVILVLTLMPLFTSFLLPPLPEKKEAVRLQIAELTDLLHQFKRDTGRYPTTEEGFAALLYPPVGVSNWRGPYLGFKKKKNPQDPWGYDYHYRMPGLHSEFDLYTLGADNADGGSENNQDIGNWK